ncbi:hypothetical protein GCM10010921_06630 [Microbacterium album]|uniref:NAD(P)-dependent oxidoreductase n=1 Tax=Microbacterium album TaxID=2053191 RepID=A0A917ID96_9MICO|nr:hypothetical protein GCM10010921_06630 [Microbacterium album]
MLGLGEAGRCYARGLADAGADTRGFDPYVQDTGPGLDRRERLQDCVDGADVVLSLVGARASVDAARAAIPAMRAGAVFADLNTASPETKARIAALGSEGRVPVADVAVLAPVTRAAHRTPLLASGDGAEPFAAILRRFGAPVDVAAGPAGDAARLKLLRGVFMKGMAALVLEGLEAARTAGAQEWLRGQIARELGPEGAATVDRLVEGTFRHAERRRHEMSDALALLEHAGTPADMTRATLAWFERILAEREAPEAGPRATDEGPR